VAPPSPINAPDRQGRTSLHYAAGDGNSGEVRRLLEAGADANHQDADGWSPLHFAAQVSSPECTDALLQSGANPSLEDSHGNTALFRAVFASQGEGEIILLLRRAGANPTKRNAHGMSPVALARTIANYDTAAHFADLGATDVDP
jgi:uncharacterized protein